MKEINGGVCAARGFKAGALACAIKKADRLDVAMVYSEVPAQAAAIFTTNKVKAAPVILSQKHLSDGMAQAIIANSGNANACTGAQGDAAAASMCKAAGSYLKIPAEMVLVASTGTIGIPLPVEKIARGLDKAVDFLSVDGGVDAAKAIMTTDTFSKVAAVEIELGGKPVRIGGMAKGSGMIHPNMATMLGFITTDAAIAQPLLQKAIARAGEISFNRVTVDGDTSTNDSLFILANGKAENQVIQQEDADYFVFLEGLEKVCLELAKMLAKDGEGATKFVEIRITGAASEAEAVVVGKAIATSNLVKTALFGEDANWGRILAAAGYSGAEVEPEKVDIYLGDLLVCRGGTGLAFDEEKAATILAQKEFNILIDLGRGSAEATVWTCDLSYDYVKINGSYRT